MIKQFVSKLFSGNPNSIKSFMLRLFFRDQDSKYQAHICIEIFAKNRADAVLVAERLAKANGANDFKVM